MDMEKLPLSQNHQIIADRFVAACRADERIVAAFLVGSYAGGTADAHSDLDLYLIIADEAYDDFVAGRAAFGRTLGEPAFLQDFDVPSCVLMIFPDGVEVDIALGRESDVGHIFGGPLPTPARQKRLPSGSGASSPAQPCSSPAS